MRFIGITGGIGAGKSEILSYIGKHYRCRIYLADEVAHLVKEPGTDCFLRLTALLGREILTPEGRIDKKKMAEKIFADRELLEKVGLPQPFTARFPHELSGGQRQRVGIARALAVKPEVILMDEPTSALDPISTMKIEELCFDLKKDYTIVIVTHNMQQATRISDKTAFFLHGEIVEFGETEKLFSMPTDKRTEDYITGRFG